MEDTVTGQRDMILVPRIPTAEMLDAAWADALAEDARGVWNSMNRALESSTLEGESLRAEGLDSPASGIQEIGS